MSPGPLERTAGSDVSRGRIYLPPIARLGLFGVSGISVLGFMAWALMPAAPKAASVQQFNHTEGRPWVSPVTSVTASMALPASPPPTPPAKVAANDAPPGDTTPSVHAMGFWQDASVVQGGEHAAQQAAEAAQHARTAGDGSDPLQNGVTRQQVRAGVTARAVVGKPFNLHFLLKRNTIFHCLPEQPIDSSVAGPIGCMVTEDVMSADGSVVLIEQGSTVDGEIMRGPALGYNRMALEFDEIMTLKGIPIYLSASAGDTLGTVGVDGYVDEHLWQKIKGALLLSMIEIAGNVVSNETQNAGTVNLNVASNTGQGLAQQMLAHDIDIPPTLYRNQAQPLTVIVRQDIPMDDAYKLALQGE